MSGIKYKSQIEMTKTATEDSHVPRLADIQPLLMTKAEFDALEDAGSYPTLRRRQVVLTDVDADVDSFLLMTKDQFDAQEDDGVYPALKRRHVLLTDVDNDSYVVRSSDAPNKVKISPDGLMSVNAPVFGGVVAGAQFMAFYLDPAGDDSNDALSVTTPGRNLHMLLERLANDTSLPRDYGISVTLAAGEYTLPQNYSCPFLNRPLYIAGLMSSYESAKTVILNVSGAASSALTFRQMTSVRYLTIKGTITSGSESLALLTFSRYLNDVAIVLFENTDNTNKTFSALRFAIGGGRVYISAFKDFACCVSVENSMVFYHHYSSVNASISGNDVFVSNVNGIVDVRAYQSLLATNPVEPVTSERGLTTFRGNSYVASEMPTGQVWIDGKPIYRRVFTGNIVAAVNALHSVNLVAGVSNMVNWGGWWMVGGSNAKKFSVSNLDTYSSTSTYRIALYINASNQLDLESVSGTVREGTTNNAYQVWVEYTKL